MTQHAGDVLIVDDETTIAGWIAESLGDEGYTTRVAYNGASALLALRDRTPDVVLLDIAMPVIAGDELLLRMRRGSFPELPIVVMTAGMHSEAFLAHGATYVMDKPLDLDRLLSVVAHYVRLQRSRREQAEGNLL